MRFQMLSSLPVHIHSPKPALTESTTGDQTTLTRPGPFFLVGLSSSFWFLALFRDIYSGQKEEEKNEEKRGQEDKPRALLSAAELVLLVCFWWATDMFPGGHIHAHTHAHSSSGLSRSGTLLTRRISQKGDRPT